MTDETAAREDGHQHTFPCDQCGGQLSYQPGSEEMVCAHCGNQHRIHVSRDPILEYNYHTTLQSLPGAAPNAVSQTVDCEECGAEFEFDRNINADACPFCGTPVVVDSHENRHIQPKAILPLGISAEEGIKQYRKWIKRLWFAPSKLKKYARRHKKLIGVYIPYWTYDCHATTRYSGDRGDVYQVPQQVRVMVNGRMVVRTQMVTKIRWTPASGVVQRDFDDVLVYASDSLPREVAREAAPWDLQNLRPYQEEYVSGFQSEIYQTDLEQGFDFARQRMQPAIRQDIRYDIGGDQQRIRQAETRYGNVNFKHILLPFWVAGFRFRNRTYQFIVNGRTGEVQGDRPWSRWKIFFAVLSVALLVGLLLWFGAQEDGFLGRAAPSGYSLPYQMPDYYR
ncbi:MAG: zinc ribbon domain-containing protein [Pseudomonadota bacterium]|nr:zinc ribbon domain-containing protein [Pseudomonadota bacterium]